VLHKHEAAVFPRSYCLESMIPTLRGARADLTSLGPYIILLHISYS
jgi:hypothetical protein